MSDLTFRARNATEIVDGTFRLYREHFVSLLTLSTLVYLPFLALIIPLIAIMNGTLENPLTMGIAFAVIGLISIVWYPVMRGAVMVSASERYLGREMPLGDAVRDAFGKVGALFWSWIMKWILIIIGFFLFVIPGFYFLARYFAIPATVLFEKRGALEALGRSSQLSIGHKGRILGTLVLCWLILVGISIAMSMVLVGLMSVIIVRSGPEAIGPTSSLLLQLPSLVSYILTLPILVIAEMLLYYDARIRQEGYDIELMSAQLERADMGVPAH